MRLTRIDLTSLNQEFLVILIIRYLVRDVSGLASVLTLTLSARSVA